jgi:hypothetical protein
MPQELPIPRQIANEQKAFEIARIWIAGGGGHHVSLNTSLVGDPKAWGIMLANLAKHVANAYHQSRGVDQEQMLAGIKAAFEAEWTKPTNQLGGQVVKPQPPNP